MNIVVVSGVLFLLVSTGCSNGQKIDSAYLKKNGMANFKHSRESCYQASKDVIKSMGGEIKKEKAKNFKFATTKFNLKKVSLVNDAAPAASDADSKQHKIYISVKGNAFECSVRFIKYKLWEKGTAVVKQRNDFMHEKVFSPFFNSLFSQLKGNDKVME